MLMPAQPCCLQNSVKLREVEKMADTCLRDFSLPLCNTTFKSTHGRKHRCSHTPAPS